MSRLGQTSSLPSSSTLETPYSAAGSSALHAPHAATPDASVSAVSKAPTPAPTHVAESGDVANGANGTQPKIPLTVDVEGIRDDVWKRGKHKGRRPEEIDAMSQTAARIAMKLAADHQAVLHPDVDTPFTDAVDVVKRLLPYHIFQHPAEDLLALTRPIGKGKRKATEEDLLREEIEETRFAIQCWKRKATLEKRFKRIRTNAGKRTASDDQAYILANAILESDRGEVSVLNGEYRQARAELDKIEREKKAAVAAATPPSSRTQQHPPRQSTSVPTSYTPTQTPSAYTSQYRGYTYPYAQTYSSSPYTYNPYAPTTTPGSYSTPPPTQPQSVPLNAPPSNAHPSTATSPADPTQLTASLNSAVTSPTEPIPIQIPVSSLGELSSYGIIPVLAANAPPADQPQPAAVLKGTMQNGTVACMDINVSALQPHQASQLAVLLAGLTSRGTNAVSSESVTTTEAADERR